MLAESATVRFHVVDYLVFSASLALGLVIGVVSLVQSRRRRKSARGAAEAEEYLLGGGDMNIVLVGASILLSVLNAVFLLGGMAEVYYRGAIFLLIGIPFLFDCPVNYFIYVPTWKKQHVTSAYEYIEKRYGSALLRCWAAFLFSIKYLFFLSVVLYTPAMALNQVTGLNMHVAIVVCGAVCALYTSMGGLKAVIWTDAMQAAVMFVGLIVVCCVGVVKVGGFSTLFSQANELGRINFNNFNVHPHERHSAFSLVFGFFFTWSLPALSDQIYVQRYMAVKDTKSAQRAAVIGKLLFIVCLVLVVMLGVITSVYYRDCDPKVNGGITKGDQLLPYFFVDLLGPYPGLPGIFIAAIFAAALSTVSSVINSLAAVFLEDFIKPFKRYRGSAVAVANEHIYAKCLTAMFGVIAIALSYLAPLLGDAIIQVPPTVHGAIGAPLFFLFFAGFYIPFTNKWGAIVGSVTGMAVDLWIGIGAVSYGKGAEDTNLPVGLCLANSSDTSTVLADVYSTALMRSDPDPQSLQWLYDVSYAWFGLIGLLVSFGSGLLTSAVTNYCGYGQKFIEVAQDEKYDPDCEMHYR